MDMLLWDRFAQDPRDPRFAGLRAADRDRDLIREVLSDAYAEGRLTHEEFDARTDQLEQTSTLGELPALVADLVPVAAAPTGGRRPQDFHAEALRRYRRMREQALYGFLAPTIVCWVIWALVMFGEFPWPALVTAATSLRWLQLVFTRDSVVADLEQHLARREERRLEKRRRDELRSQSWPPSPEPPRPPDPPQPPA